jgi:hypothetical protein
MLEMMMMMMMMMKMMRFYIFFLMLLIAANLFRSIGKTVLKINAEKNEENEKTSQLF